MQGLLAIILAAWGMGAPAASAASTVACDKPLRFAAAWFASPELDNTKSAAEISRIGASSSITGTQIGHVVVQTKLSVQPQDSCSGFIVRLDFIKPVLRVASEFAPGSCAYARVLNHEQTHVRIYRDIARQFRELDYPWAKGASQADILAHAKLELDRLMHAQTLFDSPEEYGRNETVCAGEIPRIMGANSAPPTPPR